MGNHDPCLVNDLGSCRIRAPRRRVVHVNEHPKSEPWVMATAVAHGWDQGSGTTLRNTGPSRAIWLPQYLSVGLFRLSKRLRHKVAHAGEIADYVSWLKREFGDVRHLPTREKLWERMAQRVTEPRVHGMEFGVAYGYGTGWVRPVHRTAPCLERTGRGCLRRRWQRPSHRRCEGHVARR
jgi:hypothetical protein